MRSFQRYKRRLKAWAQSHVRYCFYRFKYRNPGHPSKELVININDIKMMIDDRSLSRQSLAYRKIYKAVNMVIEGDFWGYVLPISENDTKLKGFYERFVLGMAWEDTSLFEHYKELLQQERKVQGCRDLGELIERYEHQHDKLYCRLKSDGIKSARGSSDITPIYVYIYKDGEFVYTSGGNHRLYMGKVLGLTKMPVLVRGRHVEWQAIRDELYILGSEAFQRKYPEFSTHPDLEF